MTASRTILLRNHLAKVSIKDLAIPWSQLVTVPGYYEIKERDTVIFVN